MIRCSTSAGANYCAARLAQSKASFIPKFSISLEEADESSMWFEMIIEKKQLSPEYFPIAHKLHNEAIELTSILITTRKTAQNNFR